MLLKCFTFFYIKDNSVGNSVDFNNKKNGSPFTLFTMSYILCDSTFRGREEREKNNYFAKFYRKTNEMI